MNNRLGFTSALWRVSIWTLPVGLYSVMALWRNTPPFSYVPDIPVAMEAGLVFAASMLIAFRINRAYERWWEARTLWGQLVNVSRNLAAKVKQLAQLDAEESTRARELIVAFAYGLKDHLREEVELTKLPGFETSSERPDHIPSFLVNKIYGHLADLKRSGRITGDELWVIDSESRALLDVCGACERIKKTLPSISWRWFTRHVIIAFLAVLPWGLVEEFGYWTIPLSMAICYFVSGGEVIARFVEEPFGYHEDHLDLDSICHGIDQTVSEILDVPQKW